MSAPSVKEEARKLVESLDDSATWEDLRSLIYLRAAIERGRHDVEAGRTLSTDALRTRLGILRAGAE